MQLMDLANYIAASASVVTETCPLWAYFVEKLGLICGLIADSIPALRREIERC